MSRGVRHPRPAEGTRGPASFRCPDGVYDQALAYFLWAHERGAQVSGIHTRGGCRYQARTYLMPIKVGGGAPASTSTPARNTLRVGGPTLWRRVSPHPSHPPTPLIGCLRAPPPPPSHPSTHVGGAGPCYNWFLPSGAPHYSLPPHTHPARIALSRYRPPTHMPARIS